MLPQSGRWIDTHGLYDSSGNIAVDFTTQYLKSYLSALQSLVLKLRDVTLNAENVYVILEFIAGILAYGTVFGNIHSIVEMMDHTAATTQAEERHKFEMTLVRKYMRDKGLQPDLQKMVNAHKELQWRRGQGMDEAHLFDDIPKSVQQDIKNYLYLELVKKVPLFSNTDAHFQNSVTFRIKPLMVLNGWYVFRKGDEGEEMYFVKSGTVEIVGESGQIFAKLTSGNFFGEIALFEETKRTASARASGNVELCVLTKEDFNAIMNQYPIIADRIRFTIEERKKNEQNVKNPSASAISVQEKDKDHRKRSSANVIGFAKHSHSNVSINMHNFSSKKLDS
ncbi:Kinesin-like protein kif27 [Nowakowskiella sp. JEL0407]|nr:Kinesin-like protein kif27 [Nowakowskiella sp. JEL0407]